MTHALLQISVGSPLGIGLALVCVTGALFVAIRYRRQGLSTSVLLLTAAVVGLIVADIRNEQSQSRTLFLVDTSASVRPLMQRLWWQDLRDELTRLNKDKSFDLAFFDGQSHHTMDNIHVDEIPRDLPASQEPLQSTPQRVLQSFGASFQNSNLILIGDGNYASRAIDDLRSLARARNLNLFQLPLPSRIQDSARIVSMRAPGVISPGKNFMLNLRIESSEGGAITLKLYGDGIEAQTLERSLAPNMGLETSIEVSPTKSSGLISLTLEATHQMPDDLPQNNQQTLTVMIGNQRPVLYLRGSNVVAASDPLYEILRANDHVIELHESAQGFTDPAVLSAYSMIVLNDVPLSSLGQAQQAIAQANLLYRTPLCVVGASSAFGPGGYSASELEQSLPLLSDPTPAQNTQHILLLDASASMGEESQGRRRFDLLNELTLKYLKRLSTNDQVMVVPFNTTFNPSALGFDKGFRNVDRATLNRYQDLVTSITPSGETLITNALHQALNSFALGEALPKRLVMISDGETSEGKLDMFRELGQQAANRDIQIDMLLVTAEVPEWLNTLKQGMPRDLRIYRAEGYQELFDSFEQMLRDNNASLLHEEEVESRLVSLPNELQPIATGSFPIQRWVETSLADSANVALHSTASDIAFPLIAWREGGTSLGRSLALSFACDGANSSLAQDKTLQQQVQQLLDWLYAQQTQQNTNLNLSATRDADNIVLSLKAGPPTKEDLREIPATLLGTSPSSFTFRYAGLLQGQSLWQARISSPTSTTSTLRLRLDDAIFGNPYLTASLSYHPEYAPLLNDTPLERTSAITRLSWGQSPLPKLPENRDKGAISQDVYWALGFTLVLMIALTLWLRRPPRPQPS